MKNKIKTMTTFKKIIFVIMTFLFLSIIILNIESCGATLQLTEEEKNNPDKLLDKGREYYAQDEFDIAIEVFQMVLNRFPTYTYSAAWSQYEIGMSYYLKGKYKKAKEAFITVLQKYPIPHQPRVLALKLIRKIDSGNAYKRSTYRD